jgi:acyl carrier protein
MTNEEIMQRLRRIIGDASTEEINLDAVKADTKIESLGLDSLAILDLLYDLEQEFGTHIEPADVMEIDTVGGIADLLARHVESA